MKILRSSLLGLLTMLMVSSNVVNAASNSLSKINLGYGTWIDAENADVSDHTRQKEKEAKRLRLRARKKQEKLNPSPLFDVLKQKKYKSITAHYNVTLEDEKSVVKVDIGTALCGHVKDLLVRENCLAYLIRHQEDINEQDMNGNSLLHLCVMFGYVDGVAALLEKGSIEEKLRNKALHTETGYLDPLMGIWGKCSANVKLKNKNKETAKQAAVCLMRTNNEAYQQILKLFIDRENILKETKSEHLDVQQCSKKDSTAWSCVIS